MTKKPDKNDGPVFSASPKRRSQFGDVVEDLKGVKWTCVPRNGRNPKTRKKGFIVGATGYHLLQWESDNGDVRFTKPRGAVLVAEG